MVQMTSCNQTTSDCLFDCDSCGKEVESGVAYMIVYPIVFVICWPCSKLLYDDEDYITE